MSKVKTGIFHTAYFVVQVLDAYLARLLCLVCLGLFGLGLLALPLLGLLLSLLRSCQ